MLGTCKHVRLYIEYKSATSYCLQYATIKSSLIWNKRNVKVSIFIYPYVIHT